MNCNLCYLPYNRQAHIPKVLPCCGKSLCNDCCINLDNKSLQSCPFCNNPHQNSFQSFIKNMDLIDNIPEGSSSLCSIHHRINEIICKSCEKELCLNCIKSHSGNDHDIDTIEAFLSEIKTLKKDLRDWFNQADKKAQQYEKEIKNYENLLIKNVNEEFENLIVMIKTYQQKSIAEIEERFKSLEFKYYFLEGQTDIRKTIQECEQILCSERDQSDILQYLKISKLGSLKKIMKWANRDDTNELNESLRQTHFKFEGEFKNPFKLFSENYKHMDEEERYPRRLTRNFSKEEVRKNRNFLEDSVEFHRKNNSKKLEKALKDKFESASKDYENYKELGNQVEKRIYSFFNDVSKEYKELITSILSAITKNKLDLKELKSLININFSDFQQILNVKNESKTEEELFY